MMEANQYICSNYIGFTTSTDAFFTQLKILIEVDHLQGVATPYLQIKGTNKDIVSSAGSALSLDGSYTTKVWLEVFSQSMESICIYLTYFLYLFSFMVSFWFAELSSNYFGELTSWWKCFGWYSQSTSCKAAGTGWVHPVSGMFSVDAYVCSLCVQHTWNLSW